LPFTLYLATGYIGARMRWEGSTAKSSGAPALDWEQVREMTATGLCTVGNHTHSHVSPDRLTAAELDDCTAAIVQHLAIEPRHFAYPWGIHVPRLEGELRRRFRSAATGQIGRNMPGHDSLRLRRVPVRRTDPPEFFRAKLTGCLFPERTYAAAVLTAKRVGIRA
jgi:peptidoglycan/xylan/chitin deacetylase (PgdA/CDA1 family)